MPSPLEVPRLLAVDDDSAWRNILERQLGEVDGDHLVVPIIAAGVQQIETGLFAGMICDGLEGEWPHLHERSYSYDMRFVLLSDDESQRERAEDEGIHAFDKTKFSSGMFGDIVGILLG